MNWSSYIQHWDDFLEDWLKNPISLAQNDSLLSPPFNIDDLIEIPEPYYCGTQLSKSMELDAVIVNLNPGASAENEWVKFHCNANLQDAYMIYELAQCKSNHYQKINQLFNPLLNLTPANTPGKEWWETKRLKWLDRFYPSGNRANGGYKPEKIFVLELCPWHSKSFMLKPSTLLNAKSKKYIADYVIDPLADAISHSRLKGGKSGEPYGLCFGKAIYDILTKNFSFTAVNTWNSASASVASLWPQGSKGLIDRTYSLIEGKDSMNNSVRLLCFWYQSVGAHAPSVKFNSVENYIKSEI